MPYAQYFTSILYNSLGPRVWTLSSIRTFFVSNCFPFEPTPTTSKPFWRKRNDRRPSRFDQINFFSSHQKHFLVDLIERWNFNLGSRTLAFGSLWPLDLCLVLYWARAFQRSVRPFNNRFFIFKLDGHDDHLTFISTFAAHIELKSFWQNFTRSPCAFTCVLSICVKPEDDVYYN